MLYGGCVSLVALRLTTRRRASTAHERSRALPVAASSYAPQLHATTVYVQTPQTAGTGWLHGVCVGAS